MSGRLILCLILVCVFFSMPVDAQSMHRQDLLRVLDPLVDKALAAYNSDDDARFFENFAQRSYDITTPQYYKNTYIDVHKRELGDYETRVLLEEKSSFDKYYPVLVFKAKFVKNDKVIITARFMNEHGFYRITSVDFDKIYFNQQ